MVDTSPRAATPAPQDDGAQGGGGAGRWMIRRSLWVFWLLFAINMVNYLDRLIAVAVGPTIKTQFHLTDDAIGLLGSAFLLVYTLAALPAAALADRLAARARVVAVGVGVWSLFSGLTAFVRGYTGLFVTRALVGVGEASYSPAGVALLTNYYPRERRASVIGRWQAGQVLGALLAFMVAGLLFLWLPAQLAWRAAFLLTALPGLALAALMWRVADHPANHPDATNVEAEPAARPRMSLVAELRLLLGQARETLRIPTIWMVVLLQAIVYIVVTPSVTFLPLYVRAAQGPYRMGAAHASFALGSTLILGGFLGTILGGLLSDRLNRRFPGGRLLAVTIGFALAVPCFCQMLLTSSLPVFLVASALTTLFLNLPGAALTAAPQDVAPPHLRATALAVMMLLSHLLGDIWASWAVGRLATALHEQLAPALLIVGAPALAIGCILSLIGARIYARHRSAFH